MNNKPAFAPSNSLKGEPAKATEVELYKDLVLITGQKSPSGDLGVGNKLAKLGSSYQIRDESLRYE